MGACARRIAVAHDQAPQRAPPSDPLLEPVARRCPTSSVSTKRSASSSSACGRSTPSACPSSAPPVACWPSLRSRTTDLPPFASSAMDGFAVRAAEVSAGLSLPVVERIAAGSPAGRPLATGEAMAVSTGGVVPDGADAVIPIELVDERDGTVTLRETVESGANVRGSGGDTRAGEPVLQPGVRLGPAQIGALAAAGVHEVQCRKRPRVGILVTGSELRQPGEELGPGEIYESNGLQLAASLADAGAVPAQLGIVPDDEDALERTMERALLGFDMLVTSGGASVGPHDLVRKVQAGLRVEEVFWGVAVKPGKPVAFSMRRSHPIFNLPGNPGLRPRVLRALRAPGRQRAARPARPAAGVFTWNARGAGAPERASARVRPRAHSYGGRRRPARAVDRAGVAHDRPRGCRRCLGLGRGRATASSPRASACASWRSASPRSGEVRRRPARRADGGGSRGRRGGSSPGSGPRAARSSGCG